MFLSTEEYAMVSRSASCMWFGLYCLLPAVAKSAIVDEEVDTGTLQEKRAKEKKYLLCERSVWGCSIVQVLDLCQASR